MPWLLGIRNVQAHHLVDWLEPEAVWLGRSDRADVLVGCEAVQNLQAAAKGVS
jgi:hypothetical protein